MKVFVSSLTMDYLISPEGVVYSRRKDGLHLHEIASYNGKGYRRVRIMGQNYKIHRLVAENFIANPDKLPYVIHKDGDRNNNNVNNLEWSATQSNHGLLS